MVERLRNLRDQIACGASTSELMADVEAALSCASGGPIAEDIASGRVTLSTPANYI